jgi:hypothetical protein
LKVDERRIKAMVVVAVAAEAECFSKLAGRRCTFLVEMSSREASDA